MIKHAELLNEQVSKLFNINNISKNHFKTIKAIYLLWLYRINVRGKNNNFYFIPEPKKFKCK